MQPDMIQPNNYRIDEAKYKSLLKYIRLSVTEKYEFPQEIVQIDGVTIATIGNFSASTGKPKSNNLHQTYTAAFGETITGLAEEDENIIAITAAMTDGTGLAGFKKKFPERFYDAGIAEQHAVTFAAGLANAGKKPVVAIYSSFIQRAYDQIMEEVKKVIRKVEPDCEIVL